ncbi:MAG: hypothetical protein GSR78_04415 [Desulfurococcales archaeon]|nr:hypothetical protein [Desulfurococcales archaeon]
MRLAPIALIAIVVAGLLAAPAMAARAPGIVILADLSHGQPASGLEVMMDMIPEAEWILLIASPGDEANIPEQVLSKASAVRYGGFTPDNIADVDVILFGQPTLPLQPEEIQAIVEWFNAEGKPRLIWVAGDSDYPAQGSEVAQQAMNQILEALGSKLRADYVSVEDEKSFAGKTYRVVGLVQPDPEVAVLACGAEKTLFHGPGPLYALDDYGNPVNPVETKVPGVYVVVTTTEKGKLVQHQSAAKGGLDPEFYTNIGDYGVFPLLLVEVKDVNSVPKRIIASGETPYGGYQAGVTWEYKGIPMQGPNLFRNLVYWGTGYMGDLLTCSKAMMLKEDVKNLASDLAQTKSEIQNLKVLKAQIQNLGNALDLANTKLGQLEGKIGDLEGKVGQLEQDLNSLSDTVNNDVAPAAKTGKTAQIIGIIAVLLALAAIGLAFTRKG